MLLLAVEYRLKLMFSIARLIHSPSVYRASILDF